MVSKKSGQGTWEKIRVPILVVALAGAAYAGWWRYKTHLWLTNNNRGVQAIDEGRYADAEENFRAAIDAGRGFGGSAERVGRSERNLAAALIELGRRQEAGEILGRLKTSVESAGAAADRDDAEEMIKLSDLCFEQMRFEDARSLLRRAIEVLEKDARKDDVRVAEALGKLAFSSRALDDYKEAEASYRRAGEIFWRAKGETSLEVGMNAVGLAEVLLETKQFEQAEKMYLLAIPILEERLGKTDQIVFDAYISYADVLSLSGRREEAMAWRMKVRAGE